jgi:hypothetical protein
VLVRRRCVVNTIVLGFCTGCTAFLIWPEATEGWVGCAVGSVCCGGLSCTYVSYVPNVCLGDKSAPLEQCAISYSAEAATACSREPTEGASQKPGAAHYWARLNKDNQRPT